MHILVGIKITSKNRNKPKIDNKEPDLELGEKDLSLYFYYWLDRARPWNSSGEPAKKLIGRDFILFEIWRQALRRIYPDQLRKGEVFKFSIEFTIKENIPPRWKQYCISLCPICKRGVNIHLSRPVKYCPKCRKDNKMEKQRLRRAIKNNQRLCKNCGKPLPKEYPNRKYCMGGACKQKEYRRRKLHELYLKAIYDDN